MKRPELIPRLYPLLQDSIPAPRNLSLKHSYYPGASRQSLDGRHELQSARARLASGVSLSTGSGREILFRPGP